MNLTQLWDRYAKDLSDIHQTYVKRGFPDNLHTEIPQLGLLGELLRGRINLGYYDGRKDIEFYLKESRTNKVNLLEAFNYYLTANLESGSSFVMEGNQSQYFIEVLDGIHDIAQEAVLPY